MKLKFDFLVHKLSSGGSVLLKKIFPLTSSMGSVLARELENVFSVVMLNVRQQLLQAVLSFSMGPPWVMKTVFFFIHTNVIYYLLS